MSFLVGITNARLSTAKHGIAVQIAARLAANSGMPVCLIGADPTDRDVQRHLPQLAEAWGRPTRMEIARGLHQLEIASFASSQVCVVAVSDRESMSLALPALQERFGFLIVDAPSLIGLGVGIAGVLLDWLDAIMITTGVSAGEIAETRRYTERLEVLPSTRRVDIRVLPIGDPEAGGLAHEQLDARLALLPILGHVPRLPGTTSIAEALEDRALDAAFRPIIRWIIDTRADRDPAASFFAAPPELTERHIANRLYREGADQ